MNGLGFIRGNDYRMNICSNAQMIMSDNTHGRLRHHAPRRLQTPRTGVRRVRGVQQRRRRQQRAVAHRTRRSRSRPPPVKATPPFPQFACDPTNDVTVTNGETGHHDRRAPTAHVNFQNGSTVTLAAGDVHDLRPEHAGRTSPSSPSPGWSSRSPRTSCSATTCPSTAPTAPRSRSSTFAGTGSPRTTTRSDSVRTPRCGGTSTLPPGGSTSATRPTCTAPSGHAPSAATSTSTSSTAHPRFPSRRPGRSR